jgi:small subunit ribosomal protein S15
MVMEATKKQEIIKDFRLSEKDTGSAEVQIALLTGRINHLTGHLKGHRKDFASRRGLLQMVGRRSALLKYLTKVEPKRYEAVIQKLGIRK